jgi:predicted nucleic acid-binding Zn ribbon protein
LTNISVNNEKPIKIILGELLKSYNLQDKVDELSLKTEWEKIVGGVIARRTQKIYVKQGNLFVWVDSAPLKQELGYHKDMIIERINATIGKQFIKDIIIK